MHNAFDYYNDTEYLAHYGVLGMRWGVRHNPKRTYQKATKKRDKLIQKANKKTDKAKKAVAKTPSRAMRWNDIGIAVYDRKMRSINAKNAKAARAQLKAEKWIKSMEKEFRNIPLSELT